MRALVGSPHRPLGQHAADQIGLAVVGARQPFKHLFLPLMIAVDGESHQLVERQRVLRVDLQQAWRDGGQTQALTNHRDRDEEGGGDFFLGPAFLTQGLKGAKLVERVQRGALDVLGQTVLLGDAAFADDAGDRRGLGQTLLLDQQFERAEAPATGGDFEHAGLLAVGVHHRTDGQALQQGAASDVFGEFFNRHASLDAADVGLRQDQLVERNIARGAEGDLGDACHLGLSKTGAESLSLSLKPVTRRAARLFLEETSRRDGFCQIRKAGEPRARISVQS